MEWILERLPVIIFVLVFVVQIVRGLLRSREGGRSEKPARPDELDAHRRAQEIQREIRRKIAERRAAKAGEPPLRRTTMDTPQPSSQPPRDPTAIPDPFGGPLRRMFEEIERRAEPEPPPPPPPLPERRSAELERQERLATELRELKEAAALAERRAAHAAAAKDAQAKSATGLRTAARSRLLGELRDPDSLRRAFVLREVLGPPVGLRR